MKALKLNVPATKHGSFQVFFSNENENNTIRFHLPHCVDLPICFGVVGYRFPRKSSRSAQTVKYLQIEIDDKLSEF